jgi:UDP-N-acetylmuramoyl-tripeptide--D-alanyl-D-alanine ligase
LIGLYNANNINAAITFGKYLGVSNSDIKNAIESYFPENNRSQLVTKGSNEIILDAYNANPSSMKVALENFIQLKNVYKIAILGDMFELGKESLYEHKSIVDSLLLQNDLDCIFIGNDFYENKTEKLNFNFFKTFEDFKMYFENFPVENKMILIKGSRGMALERTLDFFR